jgi:hypothetical protein
MPKITTERRTEHTLVLTDAELDALRQSALVALEGQPTHACADTWRAFARLGKPATRTRPLDALQSDRVERGFAEE